MQTTNWRGASLSWALPAGGKAESGERSSIGLTQAKPDFRRRWMGMATHDTQPG